MRQGVVIVPLLRQISNRAKMRASKAEWFTWWSFSKVVPMNRIHPQGIPRSGMGPYGFGFVP